MGVTIRCRKTGRSIDMGGGGFLRLRRTVSDLAGDPWKSHYRQLTDLPPSMHTDEWFEEFDEETARLIRARKIRVKTAFFLLQSDIEGYMPPGGCRQLLELIGDYDDNLIYGYAAHPHAARFRDFVAVLKDCADTGTRMTWS